MDRKQSYENMSDEQLVQVSLENQDCFYYLMKKYEPRILRYIKRLTNISQDESADILQEIFIKVYRNLNGFNQKLKFSSWIYRIAHNEIINQYHKRKSYSAMINLNIKDDDVNNMAELVCDTFDVQDDYIFRENTEKVREALKDLPDKYREILILRFLEDKSYDEISHILRKPAGTVATLINRAKSKFREIAKHHQLESLI
ncbi:MAG: RNA polymerase sigma-70 factor, ECF subfamily [Desulfobacteraceae bacterium Eth-SRB1]|nr:MAG: RNA polymerase sigma-70 factor, ECF subfamily [Desulfobacteraceae bacterium Eth-SRB1]